MRSGGIHIPYMVWLRKIEIYALYLKFENLQYGLWQLSHCLCVKVSPSFRTAINIPQNIWPQFREKLYAVGASLLVDADNQTKPCDAGGPTNEAVDQQVSPTYV